MSANRVCWSRAEIDFATQVDVGGLEVDDPRADAVFRAIHQSLPIRRIQGKRSSRTTEDDVLKTFTRRIDSNEPLLLFVTGAKGTGKSHLVRWLKSRLGPRPAWHVVYIEKRNTSLRRVTERILAGINTPKAKALREKLARASSEIATDEEAMSALLARLDQLVTFDLASEIRDLPEVSAAELADLRHKTHRLLGDFTFREELSKAGGPVRRIVRLARGTETTDDLDEANLHLAEADLQVDPSSFDDLGPELQGLVASLVSNRPLRADIAALCNWYLPRAKAEVFMGQGTDLLDVFEDVREEIAARRQELCLLIEDLVLLHGIDKQLAQALTIPASARLCKLRAAIAVTSGYLGSMDTFTDRGVQFTLDIGLDAIGGPGLRDFVGRYLNAGRLPSEATDGTSLAGSESRVPNACLECPDLDHCHETFGKSGDGYGFYPFNEAAIDRLVELASPGGFQPREILREVIRAPLETAEDELPRGGTFPSGQFARNLDELRTSVPFGVRAAIRRENQSSPETEVTLRAFYAQSPPATDRALESIASYFGDVLTANVADDGDDGDESDATKKRRAESRRYPAGEIDQWANGVALLSSPTANRIRRWICEAVVAHLQNGPYGLPISKVKAGRWEYLIGSYTMRLTDVWIDRSQGGGAVESPNPFRINATDENAGLISGLLAAADGNSLDSVGGGRWFFYLQTRISDYADTVARVAMNGAEPAMPAAIQALEVLRHASTEPGQTVQDALPTMFVPPPSQRQNPVVREFLREVQPLRDEALATIRTYATAAKGTGKPSLLDVGPIYRDLRSHLRERSVGDNAATDGGSQLLRRLQIRQARASEKAWADVTKAVQAVAQIIDPAEDLAATLKVVDRLVRDAQGRGRLPRADSEEAYDEARKEVDAEMMEVYRRLSKKTVGAIGPGDLWDIADDPLPRLTALSHYANVTDRLLSGLSLSLAAEPGSGVADTDTLIAEFRGLANLLEDLAGQGGR